MLTRYTIDQILSCNNNPDHHTITSKSPRHSVKTPPLISPRDTSVTPITPSSPDTLALLKRDVEMTEDARYSFREPQKDLQRVTPSPRASADCRDSAVTTNQADERRSPSRCDPGRLVVARPVPVRPTAPRSNEQSLERSSVNSSIGAPSTDGQYSGIGYGLANGLGVENSFYSLMLRHYMEAQFHGLANSRTFTPLAYPMLDSGLPHLVRGATLPYQLSTRSRRRGGQVRFTGDQTRQLESWFHLHKYINPSQRKTIARELSLQERQVKTWFQNRRAKWRKLEAQPGGDGCIPEMVQSPSSSQGTNGENRFKDELEDSSLDDDPDSANEAMDEEEDKEPNTNEKPHQKENEFSGQELLLSGNS